ncbi:MAG: AAA family ATPase [Myxococcales bacterium]|nr:AAA family ATPase [Myxococcales bacterium]
MMTPAMARRPVELTLLGELRVSVGDTAVRLPSRKAKALLCYLAMPPGRAHQRGHLAGLLWGQSAEARARNSLRQALFGLRRALPDGLEDALVADSGEVWLDPDRVVTDVLRWESATAQPPELAAATLASLEEGELLAGLGVDEEGFEDWLRSQRERVRTLQVEQLACLASHFAHHAHWSKAAACWTRVLRLEPWGEPHHRELMRAYGRMGRRAALLRQYQACVSALHRELDAQPSAETRQLYETWLAAREPASSVRGAGRAADQLFGRTEALSHLRQRWADTERGRGQVVLVRGEAGVGKSALARALRASIPSAQVLAGRAFETEQVLSLAMWADALRSRPELFGEARWSHLPEPAQRAVLDLLPHPAGHAQSAAALGVRPAVAHPTPARPHQLFDGLLALFQRLSSPDPVLLVLDDIQWADDLSLRLLSFLGRRLSRRGPLLVVSTMRTRSSSPRDVLTATLDELRSAEVLDELALRPLDRGATAELAVALGLPAEPDERAGSLQARLWRLSEGNPFVVREAVRGMVEGQVDPDLALPMPRRVRTLVARHLEALAAGDRALVSLAAVIGREVDLTLLEALWSRRDDRAGSGLPEAIERLVQAGIFVCEEDRCDFGHDRIREVAYEALLPPKRRALHTEVANALVATGAEPGQAAYHFERAGAPACAITSLLRFAEDAARRFGLNEAIAALDQSAALLGAVAPAQRPELRVRIATRRAGYLGYLGRLGEVEAYLEAERSQVEQLTDDRLRAIYFAALGYTHSLVGHSDAATQAGEQALGAAIRAEDRRTERRARSLLAYAATQAGRFTHGMEHGQAAVAITLVPETDPEHAVLSCCNLALNKLYVGDCAGALETLELGRKRCERSGVQRERVFILAFSALVHASMGAHALATQVSKQAWSLASDTMSRTLAGIQHLFVHVSAGGGARGFRLGERDLASLLASVASAGNRHWLGLASLYAARAHLVDGDARRAHALATRAQRLFETAGDPRGEALAGVMQAVARGSAEDGRQRVAAAIETLDQLGARLDWADAHLAMAELVAEPAAPSHYRAAAARYAELGLSQRASAARTLAHVDEASC